MEQRLHGSVRTTHAIRAELQRTKTSAAQLAGPYSINEKTVLKWRKVVILSRARRHCFT